MSSTSPPKTVAAAWAAWAEDGSPSSDSEFLARVSSWTEGTAAQLLRAQWRARTKRATSTELEERLRHHLRIVAEGGEATYLEALELARRGVIEELLRARPTEA